MKKKDEVREAIARNTGFSRNEVQKLILNLIADRLENMELPECPLEPSAWADVYKQAQQDLLSAILKELKGEK